MNLTEEIAKIDTKLEGLMRELNKLKSSNDAQNREAEIHEIRSKLKHLEEIKNDLLKHNNYIC